MDPLSALGVAANVVQFVVYGINIVSKGNQLYKSADGALAENVELETASLRLQQLSGTVQGSLNRACKGHSMGSSAQSDQALEKICQECIAVSKELVDQLEKLKVLEGHPHKKWKSFRQALKSVWSKDKVEEIAERLASLRMELGTHVIISLREHVTAMSVQQDARFTSLENDAKRIIVALLVGNQEIQADIETHFDALNLTVEEEHAKTREVLKDQAEHRYRRKAELLILESLCFETMTHRYETIPEAHQETFEWIFRDPETEGKPWSNFIKWAESDSGIYWITGKAGCGKSTLMRFIVDDPRTRDHLGQWAPSETLDTPAFFFWNSGVPEQRSQAGLFRTIINEVLQKHTNLIPVVFPEEWRKALELSKHDVQAVPENWSLSRLHQAFKRLVGCSCASLRFCFFIDGLDEYEGDHEEISDYFSDLSNLPYVKFCIASRPLIIFKDAFSGFAGLRLQDLTSNDIRKYIEDKLNGHKRMKLLTKEDPKESADLVRGVIYKAEGVFLWVTLVVTSLMKGLSQRDGIPQLLKRLNTFPSDLELLYGHMLGSIDPIYMEEGSKIFQIYQAGESRLERSIEILYVALIVDLPRVFGTMNDYMKLLRKEDVELANQVTDLELSFYSMYTYESLFEYMDDRVRTRCGGLIECNQHTLGGGRQMADLQYIHRTVRDYLSREDIWTDLCRHTAHIPTYNPYLQILMSYVLRAKRLLLIEGLRSDQIRDAIYIQWKDTYQHVWITEDGNPDLDIQCRLLDEWDRVATELSERADALEEVPPKLRLHWSNYKLPPAWETNFLCEAIRQVLNDYVQERFASNNVPIKRRSGLPLLAIPILAKWGGRWTYEEIELIIILLEHGADPNEVYEGYTIWQYFVHSLHTRLRTKDFEDATYTINLKNSVKAFMESVIDLEVCCIRESEVWERVYGSGNLESDLDDLKFDLIKHTNKSDRYQRSWADSDIPSLNGSLSSSVEIDCSKESGERDDDVVDGEGSEADLDEPLPAEPDENIEEDPLFEEYHSLTTILKERFETKDNPHGADELLGLLARLKAAKKAPEVIQSEAVVTVELGKDQ